MALARKIVPRKELEQLGVYSPGKPIEEVQKELGLTSVIKMASNENPFGYSPKAKEAMIKEMEKVNLYPETMAPALAAKLADKFGISKDSFLFGNGSDEIIAFLTRAYIRPGDSAIMADITFPRYETNVLIQGGNPVKVPLQQGTHDLDGMLKEINGKTRMIFVCNPNNPTGTIVEKENLLTFIKQVPSDILIVMDEAYYEYALSNEYLQTIPLLKEHPNLVILRTFSKAYGLAALRIGYGIMDKEVVNELIKVKDPFNTDRIAQAAALASLNDNEFLQLCVARNREGMNYIEGELEKLGLSSFPSEANFLMIHLGRSGKEVFEQLLRKGIIVRSGHVLGYPDSIRVTIGNESENLEFVKALREVMAEK
ncbi:histidinol-phosphate transaminase [Pseudalkalibacillus caeni]|uniref:Histidinol-phosphate aminotransferase n=1 Tax=Exobacillus caeni TaxID=2574798 RepID=A0A5R9EY93_9BACL|nr:histidinol-phosphate transaminase [Pseudalkalibacillus caeni]TLS35010.1 histidinol-phosphate transaminase [Pseudalkalibacillus caeni]